jgi:hypothetical protein
MPLKATVLILLLRVLLDKRTLIRTLKIALVNFTCKIDNVLVNYLYIYNSPFWELFVICFVKSAQTADRRVC